MNFGPATIEMSMATTAAIETPELIARHRRRAPSATASSPTARDPLTRRSRPVGLPPRDAATALSRVAAPSCVIGTPLPPAR